MQNKFDVEPSSAGSSLIQFTTKQVMKAILNMKRGKSPGHDGWSLEHILYAGSLIGEVLAFLFNMCIRYTYLPDALTQTDDLSSRTG